MHRSIHAIIFLLPVLALALPQQPSTDNTAAPAYDPGYITTSPIHEMSLIVYAAEGPYQKNASVPCSGFIALNASQALPATETTCIAGLISQIASAPAIHNITCVASDAPDAQLQNCKILGFTDGLCGGAAVGLQKTAAGWVVGGSGDVQSFKVDCSGGTA